MADDSANKLPRPGAPPDSAPLPVPVSGDELRRLLDEQAAALEAQIHGACQPEPPAPPASNKLGARKDARFMAICTAPSINWTPAGASKVPVPYQTVQDLSNSMSTARTVRFNGSPAYLLDQTTQPKGTGDERGTGKGIRSGTVGGEVKPVSGCKTVRIEGKLVVREGDQCKMNGGNNLGMYSICPGSGTADSPEVNAESVRLLSTILEEIARQDGLSEMQIMQRADQFRLTTETKFSNFIVGPQLKV